MFKTHNTLHTKRIYHTVTHDCRYRWCIAIHCVLVNGFKSPCFFSSRIVLLAPAYACPGKTSTSSAISRATRASESNILFGKKKTSVSSLKRGCTW